MRDLVRRLERLELEATPSGALMHPWADEAGSAATSYLGQTDRQRDGESLGSFLSRAGSAIARHPLVWVSPTNARL